MSLLQFVQHAVVLNKSVEASSLSDDILHMLHDGWSAWMLRARHWFAMSSAASMLEAVVGVGR